MRSPISTAIVSCLLMALPASAAWKALRSADGDVVEVVVDFVIESTDIAPNGDATIVAKSCEDGQDIGLILMLSHPVEGGLPAADRKKMIPVKESSLHVKHLGGMTEHLNRRLRAQLSGVERHSSDIGVAGEYGAITGIWGGSVAVPSIFKTLHSGATFDEAGRRSYGECFDLRLLIDGPMNQLTVFFSLPSIPGAGASSADEARSRWYETRKQKKG